MTDIEFHGTAGDPKLVLKKKCSACGGTKHLRPGSPWHGSHVICNPCFMIWYETGITNAEKLGVESMRLKAAGEFPWTGRYASTQ